MILEISMLVSMVNGSVFGIIYSAIVVDAQDDWLRLGNWLKVGR